MIPVASGGIEQAELISVFLAPERPQSADGAVRESDRAQVLDAIINYGGELLIVVENKVFEAGDLQARRINLHGARVQIVEGQRVVVVLWRDLLEALHALRERGLVSGAEAAVLDDFLTYVEDHFPALGPYRSLALCDGVTSRVHRRLRQILGEVTGVEATYSAYGPSVTMPAGTLAGNSAYLKHVVGEADGGAEIALDLFPADTLTQAKAFYSRPSAVAALKHLIATEDWNVVPNFHFGYCARGYCWTSSKIGLDAYLELWQQQIATAGRIDHSDWDTYWLLAESCGYRADRLRPPGGGPSMMGALAWIRISLAGRLVFRRLGGLRASSSTRPLVA